MRLLLVCLGLLLGSCRAEPVDEPGPLQVGVARVRMPVPLGIGTAGFGGFGVSADPSPFADTYPATTKIHGHPDFKAVVISRGEGNEVVFLRVDTVGVFQQLRRAVVLELRERLGRDLDEALVIGASHTHSGPGRVIQGGGIYDLIADTFFPEFYEGMVDGMADAVELAYADLRPARVGHVVTSVGEAHSDRRCEDGREHENGALPLLAIERDGQIDALVMAYAIHGTVLNITDLTLSQDVSGAIEQQVEDGFAHPVEVLLFNSWAGDMSPADPVVELREGAAQPDGYDRMEAVGLVVSDAVQSAIGQIGWSDEPTVRAELHRARIDRERIGYADHEFPYPWGAVYCGQNLDADCEAATTLDDLDDACIPFPEQYPAPFQTEFGAGRVGDLWFLTFPGEPGTLLAEGILERVREHGAEDVLFIGYGQDYLGYSLLEDDWWQGGYEAGGALWGPRQGEYLSDRAVEAFARTAEPGWSLVEGGEPLPAIAFGGEPYEPYVPTPPIGLGEITTDVLDAYEPTDVVELVVAGSDPWLGAPVAWLETEEGEPVLRRGGEPITSDSYAFWIELRTEPTYAEERQASERRFDWHFYMPVRHAVPGLPDLSGRYRLRVSAPTADGAVELTSGVFEVR